MSGAIGCLVLARNDLQGVTTGPIEGTEHTSTVRINQHLHCNMCRVITMIAIGVAKSSGLIARVAQKSRTSPRVRYLRKCVSSAFC